MNIKKRLLNAFQSGGISEVVRKATFHSIYRMNNFMTEHKVKKGELSYALNDEPRERRIIVSLTSFPARFQTLPLCLKSLLMQSLKPDKIVVYLGSDTDESQITDEMLSMQEFGVEYRIDPNKNLRAHKKYYYAMQEYPDDIVITADDDLYYPSTWIESMYKQHKRYPNAICARRVHKMKSDSDGLLPYNHWLDQCRSIKKPAKSLIGTGGSGKLYPPNLLDKKLFDDETFMKICGAADDIWLKCIEIYSGVNVVWVPNNEVDLKSIKDSQSEKLSTKNVTSNYNDVQLKAVMQHLNLHVKDFID